MLVRRVLLTTTFAAALVVPLAIGASAESVVPPLPTAVAATPDATKPLNAGQAVKASADKPAKARGAKAVQTPETLTVAAVMGPVATTAAVVAGANGTSPNPYAPANVGSPTHQGAGKAPENGTVGKADAKNPPGQAPNGTDANNGYECDTNQGVGNKGGNPAHSGCRSAAPTPTPPVRTSSPSPSASTSSSPSATPPSTQTSRPSPIGSITSDQPATSPSASPSPRSPRPTITTCVMGPCTNPPPPPPVCQGTCLPFTGAATDALLPLGALLFLGGLLVLLLMNLATQVRRTILLG